MALSAKRSHIRECVEAGTTEKEYVPEKPELGDELIDFHCVLVWLTTSDALESLYFRGSTVLDGPQIGRPQESEAIDDFITRPRSED